MRQTMRTTPANRAESNSAWQYFFHKHNSRKERHPDQIHDATDEKQEHQRPATADAVGAVLAARALDLKPRIGAIPSPHNPASIRTTTSMVPGMPCTVISSALTRRAEPLALPEYSRTNIANVSTLDEAVAFNPLCACPIPNASRLAPQAR